ncbi:MAG: 3-hydroxyacyl-CoA dehydrogenase NAD-binding domain-containing protein, partial [Candidatus Faecivicinus sp.]|nr:3-hydroxyacyl-CoA dehydrogenase NAD-binding domain-containing protein [Candidatus Faecivicinus sp.]
MKNFQNIVVAGGGVLGSQIAFQAAYCGFQVTIWLRSEGSIERTKPKLARLKQTYLDTIREMSEPNGDRRLWACGIADYDAFDASECIARVEKAAASIRLELDLARAAEDADLIIESMAENADDKIAFYKKLAPIMPEKTILVTNSSTLLPSKFAKYTGRPDRYLALHFANSIWKNNTAEIMAQAETSREAFEAVMAFAGQIRMVPLPVHKEKAGYLLNS